MRIRVTGAVEFESDRNSGVCLVATVRTGNVKQEWVALFRAGGRTADKPGMAARIITGDCRLVDAHLAANRCSGMEVRCFVMGKRKDVAEQPLRLGRCNYSISLCE